MDVDGSQQQQEGAISDGQAAHQDEAQAAGRRQMPSRKGRAFSSPAAPTEPPAASKPRQQQASGKQVASSGAALSALSDGAGRSLETGSGEQQQQEQEQQEEGADTSSVPGSEQAKKRKGRPAKRTGDSEAWQALGYRTEALGSTVVVRRSNGYQVSVPTAALGHLLEAYAILRSFSFQVGGWQRPWQCTVCCCLVICMEAVASAPQGSIWERAGQCVAYAAVLAPV
jgi:hypothetical protein